MGRKKKKGNGGRDRHIDRVGTRTLSAVGLLLNCRHAAGSAKTLTVDITGVFPSPASQCHLHKAYRRLPGLSLHCDKSSTRMKGSVLAHSLRDR